MARHPLLSGVVAVVLAGSVAACGGGGGDARVAVPGRPIEEHSAVDDLSQYDEVETAGPDQDEQHPASEQAELPDPCALLSEAEVEGVIGTAVGEGYAVPHDGNPFERECGWVSPQGNAMGRSVGVTVRGHTGVYSARDLFDRGRTEITDNQTNVEEIPGMGAEAYGVVRNLNSGTEVRVLSGDVYLALIVGEADTKTERHLDMAKALAAQAAERL